MSETLMAKKVLLLVFLFLPALLDAQLAVPYKFNGGSDPFCTLEKVQIDSLYNIYSSKIDPDFELLNGREYIPYYLGSKYKPLLFYNISHHSSITLHGRKFDGISLDYDTYTDNVIYMDSTRSFVYVPLDVAVNKDNVDLFEIYLPDDTMTFRYFSMKKHPGFNISEGFYEVGFYGKTKYLIRHKSSVHLNNGITEYNYLPAGYVNTGNGYVKITSRRQFISLFGSDSDAVKKFIKESGIRIRKSDKKQIASVLKYYEYITNSPTKD